MTETTTSDIPALRALLEKATQHEPVIPRAEQAGALLQLVDAVPALLDAAEERDRLREFTKPLGTERRGDRVSERDELIQIIAISLDHPNLYMGGASPVNRGKADHIINLVAGFYERRALNHR